MLKNISPSRLKSLSLIFIGFLLISCSAGFNFFKNYQSRILSFSKTPEQQEIIVDENKFPVRVSIPRLGLEKDIERGSIVNGVWEISRTSATFLDRSAAPGTNGNIVIYGHNKNDIFGPIRWLEKGDKIEIQNKKGEVFDYVVESTHVVEPNEISFVEPKSTETLTLYTCTGFADSKRHIIVAKPQKTS